jgi:hypothetical protein
LLEDQWPIASCHVWRKGAAALSVLLALSPPAVALAAWFPLDSSSLMAQANENRSWSPPASGCNRASNNRHILRSSEDASLSASLASKTKQEPPMLSAFYARVESAVNFIIP